MSKQCVRLRLKDMYAIKHALQFQVRLKQEKLCKLVKMDVVEDTCKEKCNEFEIDRLNKDIQHEMWLIQSITNEIEDFKITNCIKEKV